MGRGITNGHDALVMLGEIRSDIKWLIGDARETRATQADHGSRLVKLETAAEPTKGEIPWMIILRYGAGLVPLGAALLHKVPWERALETFRGVIG